MSELIVKVGQDNSVPQSDFNYLKPYNSSTIKLVQGLQTQDFGVINNASIFHFSDCGLRFIGSATKFEAGKNYYCHAKIKRLQGSNQIFNIKLYSSNDTSSKLSSNFQQIKTIVIKEAPESREEEIDISNYFVDVEFIFSPIESIFNTLVFELERDFSDISKVNTAQQVIGRTPIIGFLELSEVVDHNPKPNDTILKIGIQGKSNQMFCINDNEIHLPRSGVFEMRDGLIYINFFSVVSPLTFKEGNITLIDQMNNSDIATIAFMANQSITYNSSTLERKIDSYILDYLYTDGKLNSLEEGTE